MIAWYKAMCDCGVPPTHDQDQDLPVLAELMGQDHSLARVCVVQKWERLSCGDITSHKITVVGSEHRWKKLEEGDVSNLKHLEKQNEDFLVLMEQVLGRETLVGVHYEDDIPVEGQSARSLEGGGAAHMDGLVALGCSRGHSSS